MMKFQLFFALLLLLAHTTVSARSGYDPNVKIAQFGIGLGGLGGFYGSSNLPVLSAGVDFGVDKMFSAGGRIGYTSSSFESPYLVGFNRFIYRWKYTYITLAGRGSYHYPIENEKLDLYGGLDLGYNIVSSKYDGDVAGRAFAASASGSYIFFGAHVGGRYYFSESLAAFGELGYGFGILNVGISLKL
ncbi:MAG TPA: hypothetical protein VNL69_08455 [Bacteroidota bacterium]|nr:hypothetical protein [Bacteroidota bacterium]